METPSDSPKRNTYFIEESVLQNMDKAKQVKKMYKSPKHYEYDPSLNGLQEPSFHQVGINQSLNDRLRALEDINVSLENRLKKLENILVSKNFTDFTEKLEELMDKLDDLQSRVDLLDE